MARETISYGPGDICAGGYALAVQADEAVSLVADGSPPRLLSNVAPMTFMLEDAAIEARHFRARRVRLANGLVVERRDFAAQGGYAAGIPGEAVYQEIPAHREYRLPAIGSAGAAVRLVSDRFFSGRTADDGTVLSRVSPLAGRPCANLHPLVEGGMPPQADLVFSQNAVIGPTRLCRSGLAITLQAGERAWTSLRRSKTDMPQWAVESSGARFTICGSQLRDNPPPEGQPLLLGYQLAWVNAETATLTPPAPAPGARRTGYRPPITIRASSSDQIILRQFIDRLRFVSLGERTCWQ